MLPSHPVQHSAPKWGPPEHLVFDAGQGGSLHVKCFRGGCPSRLPMTGVAPERRTQLAAAHGWIEVEGHVFCGRTCFDIYRANPNDSYVPARSLAADKPSDKVTRVSVREYIGHDRTPQKDLVCDRHECPTRVRVAPSADVETMMRVACNSGFQQVSHGTYCSASCAKMARADILSGRVQVRDKNLKVAEAADHVAPAPLTLAPLPQPPAPPDVVVLEPPKVAEPPAAAAAHVPTTPQAQPHIRRGPRRG